MDCKHFMFLLLAIVVNGLTNLREVQRCPGNQEEWEKSSQELNCSGSNSTSYFCTPHVTLTGLYEFCYTEISVERGYCLVLSHNRTQYEKYNCTRFAAGCPSNDTLSSLFFQYQACLNISKRNKCFLVEPTCKDQDSSENQTETVLIIVIMTSCILLVISAVLYVVWRKKRKKRCPFIDQCKIMAQEKDISILHETEYDDSIDLVPLSYTDDDFELFLPLPCREGTARMQRAFSEKDWCTFSKEYEKWMKLQTYEDIQKCWENEGIQQDVILNEFVTEILFHKKYAKRLYMGYNHLTQETMIVLVVADIELNVSTLSVFQGLPIAYKHWRFTDSSSEICNNRMDDKDTSLTIDDNLRLSEVIRDQVDNLMKYHSNLERISASPYRSKKNETMFIEEPCIVLYCTHKGVIPLGESLFPCKLGGIATDVREGFFYSYMITGEEEMMHPYNVHPTARLNQLRMGCNIGLLGVQRNSGTLGGFVDLENNSIGFITCAHVVYNDQEKSNKAVSQPGCGTDGIPVAENVCGTVVRCTFDNSTEISVDAALIKLNKRQPGNTGNFAGLLYEQMLDTGFSEPPTFNTGEIRTDLDSHCFFDYPCFKCGTATGFRDGKLVLNGAAVRYTGYYQSGMTYMLKNQYEIKHVGINHFADKGDSGAFVFQYKSPEDRNTLVCIGMVVGGTEAGTVIVTPIKDVLNGLGLDVNCLHMFCEPDTDEAMEVS